VISTKDFERTKLIQGRIMSQPDFAVTALAETGPENEVGEFGPGRRWSRRRLESSPDLLEVALLLHFLPAALTASEMFRDPFPIRRRQTIGEQSLDVGRAQATGVGAKGGV
jgi:hypothetical protein